MGGVSSPVSSKRMPILESAPRRMHNRRAARFLGLLTSVSVSALLAAGAPFAAAAPRGYWTPSMAATAAAAAAAAGSQQAAAATQQSIRATTNAIRGLWNAQAAAAAAAALTPSNIVNGLGKGTPGQIPGLVVDPRVTTNPSLWMNASLPTQTTSGGLTEVTIHQTAARAAMTWEYFNISPSTTLVFDQQGHASWVALNRIDATGAPSQILGKIKAAGAVMLINPNGIIFNGSSQVNVGSLIATSFDIATSPAASPFGANNQIPSYTSLTLSDGLSVAVPPQEAAANSYFIQNGLYSRAATTTRGPSVDFALGDQSGGEISVQAGASIATSVSSSGDGGYVALIGSAVTNAGAISTPNGQIILGAGAFGGITAPLATATGIDTARAVSMQGRLFIDSDAGPVTNEIGGLLAANDGNVTLMGGTINQFGGIAVTTSVTRPGSIILSAGAAAQSDIVLGPNSFIAILPDETGGTIPTATATAAYFASTLQPRINITADDNIDMQGGALIKAPSAAVTMAAGRGGSGSVLLESGSSIDLSGLADVVLPMSVNEVSILVTAAEVANTPLAQNLIGRRVTFDARLSGVRADGVQWVGSPLLDAAGYVSLIPKGIDELLVGGGKLTVSAPQNIIQQTGSIVDVSGGYVRYQDGVIHTTQLLGSDGRVYDIGAANPTISYVGVAGQYSLGRAQWGTPLVYSNSLYFQGHQERGYIAGASAGAIGVSAVTPILEGALVGGIVAGTRQRALAQGGGTATQTSLDQLPAGAALSIAFGSDNPHPYHVALEPRAEAGPDPFGLSGFTLAEASSWMPSLSDNVFPIFSDALSASNFGSVSITGANGLRMTADATLTVRPGGAVNLGGVTEIDGVINAPGGRITLKGFDPGQSTLSGTPGLPTALTPDLIIGATAALNVRGLWVNDSGVADEAAQGAAFVNGGSIAISTPATSAYTEQAIASGVLADGTDVSGHTLVAFTDTTQSIVLAPGSVIDVSSGGYVGTNGALKYGADGLPVGKGGSVALQTYLGGFAVFGDGSNGRFYGATTAENPVRLEDGSVVAAGVAISHAFECFAPCVDRSYAPADGALQANVVLGGAIYAAGFDGGGTFSLRAPSIKIVEGGGPTISYLTAERLDGVAAATGQVAAAYANAGTNNVGTSSARVAISAALAGQIDLPAAFFANNAFGAYVLSSAGVSGAVADVVVAPNAMVDLRQANLLPGGAPGHIPDTRQPTGAIAREFETFGLAADGLRKPVDLTLYDPAGPRGILIDEGGAINADPLASGPASISLVAGGAVTVLGAIEAPSGAINLFNINTAPPISGSQTIPATAQDVWIGRDAVLDVSAMFVPSPQVAAYATGSLLDAGVITLFGGTVVAEAGSQFLLNGGAATIQVSNQSAGGARFIDQTVWSNGGSLRLGGFNSGQPGLYGDLYFAGTVSAVGGAPRAAGGGLIIGNVPAPAAVASYVSGILTANDEDGYTLKGNLPHGARTIVLEPGGNIAASLAAVRQESGAAASYPVTPAELAALTPQLAEWDFQSAFIGADTLSNSGFDSVSLSASTIAFNGSVDVSIPGALTLVAGKGNFVLLPGSSALLASGVLSPNGELSDPSVYTSPPDASGIPGIGGAVVNLSAGYVRLVGGGNSFPSGGGGAGAPARPQVADGALNVTAQWIDLQRAIGLDNVLNANFTSADAVRLLPDTYGFGDVAGGAPLIGARFAGALVTAGNLTLTAAEIFPVSQTEFMLASTGTLAGVDNMLAIHQNGVARAPLSAGGTLLLDAENIVQAGSLWAPLGSIVVGLTDQSQIPSGVASALGYDLAAFSVATKDVSLAAGGLTSVSAAGLDIPFGLTVDGTTWYQGQYRIAANGTQSATTLIAPPAKSISLFGVNIATEAGAVIDASGGGDIYATEFVSGIGGTRNVLTAAASGQTVYALVPSSSAAIAAYDPTFAANYGSSGGSIAPGASITIAAGGGLPAGAYVLLPGMYATLPGAYRVVQVARNVNPTQAAMAGTSDGSFFVTGVVGNALTGARSSQTSLFQVQSNAVWKQYSQIDIISGTSYFRNKALAAGAVIPALPIDGGILAIGASRSLNLTSTNRFASGASDLASGLTGAGGQVQISAANILILAADLSAPPEDVNAATPYLVLDADQISNLGATSVLIGGTTSTSNLGLITATAASVEVDTDAAHPLTGPEIILVAAAGGNGITVDAGSVIRAAGSVPAGTDRDLVVTSNFIGGDGSLLRASNGAPIGVTRGPRFSASGRITIGATPGTAELPATLGAAVIIDGGNALTLDSTQSNVLASNTVLTAKNYDLSADVINIGGGDAGLVLTSGLIANFAGAQTVSLRSASVFNLYDANGLAIGDPDNAIGALTFNGAGFFSEGGTTAINAGDVLLTNTRSVADATGGLSGSNGALAVNASGVLTRGRGAFVLAGFGQAELNAGRAIAFADAGSLDAGEADVALTAPLLRVNGGADQSLVTAGALEINQGSGAAPTNPATNIGGALILTAASIVDRGVIEALSGNVALNATSGDVTLASGASIVATGSRIAVVNQIAYSPGGSVRLTALAGNVTIDSGASVDVSAAGNGYAGALSIRTASTGIATLSGALLGGAAHDDAGGIFSLSAGDLSGALPFSGGFTGSFAVTLKYGDITIGAGSTLISEHVLLVADQGGVIVDGVIDAKGPSGGAISLYGATAVTIGSEAQLIARYQAVGVDDPGYSTGASNLVRTGGVITLGASGTPDGTISNIYGYENMTGSGAINVAAGAVFDVRGGEAGVDINNSGGEVILRAPILTNGQVNVGFHGTLITNAGADGRASGNGASLHAYAVWSATDATSGARHFDGVIDPAGWYDASGALVPGTFADAFGYIMASWDGANIDGATLSYYLANAYFTPSAANDAHVGFYQQTLVNFVQNFAATADFSGAQLRIGGASAVALPSSMQHGRPEIDLINPSSAVNGGDIVVASNWNLGAGVFDSAGAYTPYYRTSAGEAGVLSLKAVNNVAVNATISDGFYETVDAFGGSDLVANLIANNPQLSGGENPQTGFPFFDYNTTGAASLMSVIPGINNGSFSYDFVAGANFDAAGAPSVDPNAVVAVAASNDPSNWSGSFTLGGHTTYANPLYDGFFISQFINVPTLMRTGTGSITITAAGNVAVLDPVAPGAIYTAGAATATPSGFDAPTINPDYLLLPNGLVGAPTWAAGGGNVTINAGQAIIGIEPSINDQFNGMFTGQAWNTWYFHSGGSNGSATPFSGSVSGATCSPGSFSCQSAAWVNYATFQGVGALGGGNISLIAGTDITNVVASLPETLAVSGGINESDPPVAHYYGGGNLLVRAGGNINSGNFLVGRGVGLVTAGGAIQAGAGLPALGLPPVPLLLAVQDGFISATARGSVALGAIYDPASLPLSYDGFTAAGNGTYNFLMLANDGLGNLPWGQLFTTLGPESGVALSSISGDIAALGRGDTALGSNGVFVPYGLLLPATLDLTAFSGNVVINAANNDANLLPYPTQNGDAAGAITIVAAQSFSVTGFGTLKMVDLNTSNAQYLSSLSVSYQNYVSPLGAPLANLTQALHANDSAPVIIAAGRDINGYLSLIKPADIEAGRNISLGFIGQNNNAADITSISAGNDITGNVQGNQYGSYYYLYGPGTLLLRAGRDVGPFQLSQGQTTAAGVATLGNGANGVNRFFVASGQGGDNGVGFSTPLKVIPYLPSEGADISVLFGVGPGIDYQSAIDAFVDPAHAGGGGIDFLAAVAAILGDRRDQAWTHFQSLSAARQHLLIDRAFLEFLTEVAADYSSSGSPYYGKYGRAYDAIGTLFPAAYGYTDNGAPGSGANGAAARVMTGQLNIAQSILATGMGGDIDIIGPGGGITVGSTSRDILNPSQEGIQTLAGGSIRVFTDSSILLNQSRIMTLQGGDIDLFSANGDISAGVGPKTYVSSPPISDICDENGYCHVNPAGLVTGAGIGALVTLPSQDPAKSNVTLVAPHGTVDAGSAGIRVSGNLNIVAFQVVNSFNVQVQGASTGLPTQATANVGALTSANNAAGAVRANVAPAPARNEASDTPSLITVEVIGYGGGEGEGDNESRRRKTAQ
jgi:filamentous hemagglutinin family protein